MAKRRARPDVCDGCPLTPEQIADCEEQLRLLAIPARTIAWCERSGVPIQAAKQDHDDLVAFFSGILENSRGQQSRHTGGP